MFDESFEGTPAEEFRRLHPAAPTLDAVRLAYAAGQRSARAAAWRWRGASALLAGVLIVGASIGLPGTSANRISPVAQTAVRVLPTGPPPVAPASPPQVVRVSPPDPSSVAMLQQRVLQNGLEGLNELNERRGSPASAAMPVGRPYRISDILNEGGL